MDLQTERLNIRELNSASDAEFICALLNSPKFIKYIGDRGVRSGWEAADFIENRYRTSYRDHGYGLYAVELKDGTPIGICGFVRRDTLPGPDIGFAFLPEFEHQGFGYESAAAMMKYGRDTFEFTTVYAITSPDNDASGSLLEKLGFSFDRMIANGDQTVKLFVSTS
ncbi:MAG TPA: GNAT family N-acetyltransferase [Pyrinomonadaceae bacterium]|nr:GNAT family N-acetyltransferase [Acidobacteriota bacterium]HQZ95445.1 GNAT family N-acetyltransferase [Pyrinomonadaceae bacterium]